MRHRTSYLVYRVIHLSLNQLGITGEDQVSSVHDACLDSFSSSFTDDLFTCDSCIVAGRVRGDIPSLRLHTYRHPLVRCKEREHVEMDDEVPRENTEKKFVALARQLEILDGKLNGLIQDFKLQ